MEASHGLAILRSPLANCRKCGPDESMGKNYFGRWLEIVTVFTWPLHWDHFCKRITIGIFKFQKQNKITSRAKALQREMLSMIDGGSVIQKNCCPLYSSLILCSFYCSSDMAAAIKRNRGQDNKELKPQLKLASKLIVAHNTKIYLFL